MTAPTMARTTPPTTNRAAPAKAATPPTFRSLLRLAGWGFCAALALGVTVTLTQTERGAERVQQAVASLYTPEKAETARVPAVVPAPAVTVAEKSFDAEQETTRLASQLRSLTADRDRLAARVAVLERNFDDITGSVKQITTSRITAPPAKTETPKPEAKAEVKPDVRPEPTAKAELPRLEPIRDQHEPAKPAATPPSSHPASTAATPPSPSPPAVMAAAPSPRPANDNQRPATPPGPRVAETTPTPQPAPPVVRLVPVPDKSKEVASHNADTEPQLATGSIPAKPEFAIDLGGASTVDALRSLWDSTKAAHAPLLDKLQPAAVLRPTGRNGTPQLRLMAGPFTEASTAAAVCRAFAQGRGTCRPFAFDGQKLPLR
ncbi:MAG: hypothetical protein J0H78_10020 [Rhizobiales bacterium]|nr:hypothetical protein [Hyphomicrobiales bacterium]OJY46569.1 MAG: hypothetical protein BGP08_16160 [Rhizobiales bacterium 64-17]